MTTYCDRCYKDALYWHPDYLKQYLGHSSCSIKVLFENLIHDKKNNWVVTRLRNRHRESPIDFFEGFLSLEEF